MNILIVDDHTVNLKLLRAQLESDGADVSEAANGFEALEILKCVRIDAIISDVLMPRMDGYRLCKEVRASARSCGVPFIAYSATYTSPVDERLMMELGADRFLRKPASAAVLASTLLEVMQDSYRAQPTYAGPRQRAKLLNEYNEWLAVAFKEKNIDLAAKTNRLTEVEDELRTTPLHLQRVLDHSPAMIYSLKWETGELVLHIVSGSLTRLLGFDVAEALSYDWWLGQLHPADRAVAGTSTAETLKHGTCRTEYRMLHKDGSVRWVEDHRRAIRDPAGEPVEFTGMWTDITKRKHTEQVMEDQRVQWQMMVGMAMNAWLVIQDDKIAYANPAAVRLLAATKEEQLLGREVGNFLHEEDFAWVVARARQRSQSPGNASPLLPQRMRRNDGSVVAVELSAARFRFRDRPALLVEARDVSERKNADSRLTLEHAVTAVLDGAASPSKINQKVLGTIGCGLEWDLGELWAIDRSAKALRCTDTWHLPSTDFQEFSDASRALVVTNAQELPWRVWASGKTEWCADISQASTCARHGQASRLGLLSSIGFPIKFRQEIVGVVVFFSRKVIQPEATLLSFLDTLGLQLGQLGERQQLAEQLRQAQKMGALGTLAGGIAHDLNGILVAIYHYCELARSEAPDNAGLAKYLDGLMSGARRATALVGQIRTFILKQDDQRRPIRLWPIATEAMQLLRAAVPVTIEFETSLGKDAPVVLADATQVHQIVMNLGINAAYAMNEQGGRLTVTLENCLVDPELSTTHPDLRVGRYARITVRDNGCGMDAETLGRSFQPFFTTKPPGEGTGLGLAVVHEIVKSHEGVITASSQPGVGTTFQVYFPAYLGDTDEH